MTERSLRKAHATLGVLLSAFILVQVGSGTVIAVFEFLGRGRHVHAAEDAEDHRREEATAPSDAAREDGAVQIVHHHGGRLVQGVRVAVGLGVLAMAGTGVAIYVGARRRMQSAGSADERRPER